YPLRRSGDCAACAGILASDDCGKTGLQPASLRTLGMKASQSYLERSLRSLASVLQESIFAEETARLPGWLQSMDPRVKAAGLLLLLISTAFSNSIIVIVLFLMFSLVLAAG